MGDKTQQLAKEFDFLYKKVIDRLKTIELTVPMLVERLDAEDKMTKQFEKISSSLPKIGGDFDDLLQGIRVDLSQRCTLNKQFKSSFQADIDLVSVSMKSVHHQIRPMISEVEKADKDYKILYDKLDKSKDKYFKASKEYEELVIAVQGAEWNKEFTADNKEKLVQKVNNAAYLKQESEAQYTQTVSAYNQNLTNTNNLFILFNGQLRQLFQDGFGCFKDLALKMLVYEISRQRNLQYDTESFFKEVEKYQCSVDVKVIPSDYKCTINLYCAKQIIESTELKKYNSFLTNISQQISLSNKVLSHNKPKIEPKKELSELEQLINDPKFTNSLKDIVQDMIRVAHNKSNPNDQLKDDQIDRPRDQEESKHVQDPQDIIHEKQVDPLHQPKSLSAKKKTLSILDPQQFMAQFSVTHPQKLIQILGIAKFIVEQSVGESVQNFKGLKSDLTFQQFKELLDQRYVREISVTILEQFKVVGCISLSKVGFKQMVILSEQILKELQELYLIKRILQTLVIIHKVQDSQKYFLSDGLITNALWSNSELWQALIYTAVEEEFAKNTNVGNQKFDREQMFKDKNTIFICIMSLTANMITFKLDKQQIKSIIAKCANIYGLYELQINDLLQFVENGGKNDPSKLSSTSVLKSLYSSKTDTNPGTEISQKVQKYLDQTVIFNQLQPPSTFSNFNNGQYLETQGRSQLNTAQNNQKIIQVEEKQNEQKLQSQSKYINLQIQDPLDQKQEKKINYKQHPLERKK